MLPSLPPEALDQGEIILSAFCLVSSSVNYVSGLSGPAGYFLSHICWLLIHVVVETLL